MELNPVQGHYLIFPLSVIIPTVLNGSFLVTSFFFAVFYGYLNHEISSWDGPVGWDFYFRVGGIVLFWGYYLRLYERSLKQEFMQKEIAEQQ